MVIVAMKLDDNPIILPSICIRDMIATGILYELIQNRWEYVEFDDCYKRWFEWQFKYSDGYSPPMDEAQFREFAREWKEIGARDALANPPYMIIYTAPQHRIEFETYEEISQFRRRMYDLGGWVTYDLA